MTTCRDCQDGNHNACNGSAIDFDINDEPLNVRCDCAGSGHES